MLRKEASKTLESLLLRLMAIVAESSPVESEDSAEESSDGSVEREAAMEVSTEKYSPFHEVEETQNATVRKYIHSEEEKEEEPSEVDEVDQPSRANEANEANEVKEANEVNEVNEVNEANEVKEPIEAKEQAKSPESTESPEPPEPRPRTDPDQPTAPSNSNSNSNSNPNSNPNARIPSPEASVPLSASLPQSPRSPLPLSASLPRPSDTRGDASPSPFLLQRAPASPSPAASPDPAARWLPVALCSVELLSSAISVAPLLSSLSAPHLRIRHRRGPATHPLQPSASPQDHHRLQRAVPRPQRAGARSLALHAGGAGDAAVPPAGGRGDLLGGHDDLLVRGVEAVAVLQEGAGARVREGGVPHAGQYRHVQADGSLPDGADAARNAARHPGEAQRPREPLSELRLRRLLPQHHLHPLLHRRFPVSPSRLDQREDQVLFLRHASALPSSPRAAAAAAALPGPLDAPKQHRPALQDPSAGRGQSAQRRDGLRPRQLGAGAAQPPVPEGRGEVQQQRQDGVLLPQQLR